MMIDLTTPRSLARHELIAFLRAWRDTAITDRQYFMSAAAKFRHELFIDVCDQAAALLERDGPAPGSRRRGNKS